MLVDRRIDLPPGPAPGTTAVLTIPSANRLTRMTDAKISTPDATGARGQGWLHSALGRAVHLERGEAGILALSFAFFFCVLCSYYILRPIRDEMGITLGRENLQQYLIVVLLVMLAAVPAFGWVVANVARQRIVPVVYLFLIANLVVFRMALIGQPTGRPPTWLAGVFFVWINVYALFVVSLFWSFMSDIWNSEQAKRLYGFISVGGTAGAISGPLVLGAALSRIGLANLMLLSAAFLGLSLVLFTMLSRIVASAPAKPAAIAQPAEKGGLLDGALNVWRSPYLFRIALFVLASNLIGMYFYLQQNEIVSRLVADRDQRLLLFSHIDLATNVLTILAQLFAVGRLIERIGVGRTAAVPPVLCASGVLLLAAFPSLWAIMVAVVAQRASAYGFSNPAMRTLYTVVDPADKYRSQNFNDTFVYRGGEAASSYAFDFLGKRIGAAIPAVAAIAVTLAWLWLAFDLGRRQEAKAKAMVPKAPPAS